MKTVLRILLPLVVLTLAYLWTRNLIANKEEPKKRPSFTSLTEVEGTSLRPQSYQVYVESRGTVQPRTETTFIPEVTGTITRISPNLREGRFFEENEVLLELDPVDYETRVTVARTNLIQAETALKQEGARARQAIANWKRLGKTGEPGELVRREPQMAEAEARVEASGAELRKAQRDVERTRIRAPFAGRILEKLADVGQYVSPGVVVARAYSVDYVEIRLPLANEQLTFLDLPETYRNDTSPPDNLPEVTLTGTLAGKKGSWKGRIVRVAGTIDARSRQLFAVAQVDDPYGKRPDGSPPLKPGLFVEARVKGRLLENVFVVPRGAVRASGEVILIDKESRLQRRQAEAIWKDRDFQIFAADGALKEGDVICVTPIAFPADGARVTPTIDGKAPARKGPPGGRPPSDRKPGGPGGNTGGQR
ncbi:MAG: efflux RND transporter periplasmic adaptor subunit [Verrucomicrobiota bacterium]